MRSELGGREHTYWPFTDFCVYTQSLGEAVAQRGPENMFSAASSSPIWKIDQQDAGQKQEDKAGEMVSGRARGGGRGSQRRVQVEGSAGRVCRGPRAGRKGCAQAFGESIHRVELPSTEPGKAVGGGSLQGEIRSSVWVWSI